MTAAAAVSGIRFRDETLLRLGGVGDCWNMTWAADDRQYAALCDGYGFPGMPHRFFSSRMYAFQGSPPHVRAEYLPGYPELLCTRVDEEHHFAYYGFGVLAVDGRIYQFLSTRNTPAEPRFVGAKLIYSEDSGRSWLNQDGTSPVIWEAWGDRSKQNLIFFREPGEAFSMLSILQMGRNYEDNRDGFVYVYGPNGNTEDSMRQLVMFRVPKDRLLDRSTYEFFAGHRSNGSPTWGRDIEDRQPVCTFPRGWVLPLTRSPFTIGKERWLQTQPHSWHPSIVYNAALGVYMMANFGMGVSEEGGWFVKPSYLGFWVADEPWGPWIQIHENSAWMPGGDPNARAYEARISPKWLAPDGRSLWLVWTDYQRMGKSNKGQPITDFAETRAAELLRTRRYSEHAELIAKSQPYYGVNVQQVEILLIRS